MAVDLDAVRARYWKALDAKPSKGDMTEAAIAAVIDSHCDVMDLVKEIERLAAAARAKRKSSVAMASVTAEEIGVAVYEAVDVEGTPLGYWVVQVDREDESPTEVRVYMNDGLLFDSRRGAAGKVPRRAKGEQE